MCVVVVAAELEVAQLVRSPSRERLDVVNLEPVVPTADNADPIAAVNLLADAAPLPAGLNLTTTAPAA